MFSRNLIAYPLRLLINIIRIGMDEKLGIILFDMYVSLIKRFLPEVYKQKKKEYKKFRKEIIRINK